MTVVPTKIYRSAKELEHYQQVRKTFEGPDLGQEPDKSMSAHEQPQGMRSTGFEQTSLSRPKYKSRTSSKAKGKGKAKAMQWNTDEDGEDEDEDDDIYVTSNDFATPAKDKYTNGTVPGKKAMRSQSVGSDGFRDASKDDDEVLYG